MKRIIYIDYLRIFVILGVICIHASAQAIHHNTNSLFIYLVNFSGRFAVPVFVMISGAIFLNKKIAINKLYKKYICRLFFCLLLFKIINYWWHEFSLVHIWFLYMIISIYIIYPLLNQIKSNHKLLIYYLCLCLIFVFIIPLIQIFIYKINLPNYCQYIFIELKQNSYMFMPLGFTVYFLLGYLIDYYPIKIKNIYILLFSLLCFLIGGYITYFISIKQKSFFEMISQYDSVFILFFAVLVFIFFKNSILFNKKNNFINYISKYVFCIYLLHIIVLTFLYYLEKINSINCYNLFIIIINIFITFILSLILAIIINKVPIINKFLI